VEALLLEAPPTAPPALPPSPPAPLLAELLAGPLDSALLLGPGPPPPLWHVPTVSGGSISHLPCAPQSPSLQQNLVHTENGLQVSPAAQWLVALQLSHNARLLSPA
jgi:hypothetical protein